MGYIYQIVNDINNKVYVGKTELNIETRWKQHLKAAKRENIKNRPLYRAINKYGESHFRIEILEQCDLEELSVREIYWINKLDSFTKGYNATLGGDGKHYVKDEEILSLYYSGETINNIHIILGYDKGTIRKVLNNNNITAQDILNHSLETKKQPVAKMEKDSLEILEVYSSAAIAEKLNGNTRHINDVCIGKRKTCKGCKWKYITKQEFEDFQRENFFNMSLSLLMVQIHSMAQLVLQPLYTAISATKGLLNKVKILALELIYCKMTTYED